MRTGYVGPLALLALTIGGYAADVAPKVIGISWVAFFAMAVAIPMGIRASRDAHARRLVWGYGLASGAMITSAAIFLVPNAIGHHSQYGGVGIAIGVVSGYGAHTIGHRLTHVDAPFDDTALRLTAHALAAGAVIGAVYAVMPELGALLGLAIVSHKGPAGYAAANRLAAEGLSATPLLIPAASVGLTAIPVAMFGLSHGPVVNALVFGFASGVFLHLAMDFLPRCEVGGEIHRLAALGDDGHDVLDRLRWHAVWSTTTGAIVVITAWTVIPT